MEADEGEWTTCHVDDRRTQLSQMLQTSLASSSPLSGMASFSAEVCPITPQPPRHSPLSIDTMHARPRHFRARYGPPESDTAAEHPLRKDVVTKGYFFSCCKLFNFICEETELGIACYCKLLSRYTVGPHGPCGFFVTALQRSGQL